MPAFSINHLTLIISGLVSLIVLTLGWETSGRWIFLSTRAQRRLQQAETPIAHEDSLLYLPAGSLELRLIEAGFTWSAFQFRLGSVLLGLVGTFLAWQFFVPGLPALVAGVMLAFAPTAYLNERALSRGLRLDEHLPVALSRIAAGLQAGRGRNPVDAVERPTVERVEFQILNEDQTRQLLIAASGSPFETIFYLALTTGMRKGELLGLKWSDLDAEKGILLVQRQLQQIARQGSVLVPPKTKAGRRRINLGQGTLAQLKAHRERQEKLKIVAQGQWQENDLIFTTRIGTFLDQSKVSKEFKRLLRNAGLPSIRFHDLRHTSISFLLGMGTPVNTVQRRAGHSKASVTTDVYGHSLDGSQEEAAQKIEELVTPIAVKLQ